jgi:hypothetical protein
MMESAISPPISAAATMVVADWLMAHPAIRRHQSRRSGSGSALGYGWSLTLIGQGEDRVLPHRLNGVHCSKIGPLTSESGHNPNCRLAA